MKSDELLARWRGVLESRRRAQIEEIERWLLGLDAAARERWLDRLLRDAMDRGDSWSVQRLLGWGAAPGEELMHWVREASERALAERSG